MVLRSKNTPPKCALSTAISAHWKRAISAVHRPGCAIHEAGSVREQEGHHLAHFLRQADALLRRHLAQGLLAQWHIAVEQGFEHALEQWRVDDSRHHGVDPHAARSD